MPYALGQTISKSPIEGGIEITDQQYVEAFAAKMVGREALVVGGELVVRDPAPSPQHKWENGEWVKPVEPEPEPIDPLTLTLSKRQINAALIVGGGLTDPDPAIEAAISNITDPVERALAFNDWRHAPYYERGHDLFSAPDLLAAMDMTPEQVDQLWALGTTLPR